MHVLRPKKLGYISPGQELKLNMARLLMELREHVLLTLRCLIAIGVPIIGLPYWSSWLEFFNPRSTTKATEAVTVPEFQEALTALRKIQAATQVSVSYHDYGQLLIEAKIRVNDAARTLPKGPARDELQAAMEAYGDSGRVWGSKLETNNPWFNADGEPGKTLIPKYGLPRDSKMPGELYSTDEAAPDNLESSG